MTGPTTGDQTLELLAYTVPVCAILVCNTVFLVWIMGVVISKLRPSDPYHQTQNVNLRAAKALIIIVPLLGITYLVTIVGPSEPDTTLETIFILTRNVLLSFQGFFITLPYCFLNGEVCTMMKSHWERWRNTQDIGQGPNSARNSIAMQGFNSVCDNLTRKRSRSYSYHVVRIGSRPLPCKIITDTVESLHCYRVASRIRSLPYVLGVTPSLPVALHHGAHLPVQEAVGQGDEESLEGEKNIPCENEDCLQSGVWF